MIIYFGQTQTYKIYPVGLNAALPDSPVSIYLFDKEPTKAEALAGTGAIETITPTWSATSDGLGKQFEIPRIDDPAATSDVLEYSYYIAINTKLETGDTAAHAPIIRRITFRRLRSQEGAISVNAGDLLKIEPAIRKFICNGDLEDYIETATEKVRRSFNGYDTTFGDIWNPEPLNIIVAYLAISNFFFGQSRGQGSMEFALYQKYEAEYQDEIKNVKLEIARQGETAPIGKIDGASKGYFSSIRMIR